MPLLQWAEISECCHINCKQNWTLSGLKLPESICIIANVCLNPTVAVTQTLSFLLFTALDCFDLSSFCREKKHEMMRRVWSALEMRRGNIFLCAFSSFSSLCHYVILLLFLCPGEKSPWNVFIARTGKNMFFCSISTIWAMLIGFSYFISPKKIVAVVSVWWVFARIGNGSTGLQLKERKIL